jgi:hypothetical protein
MFVFAKDQYGLSASFEFSDGDGVAANLLSRYFGRVIHTVEPDDLGRGTPRWAANCRKPAAAVTLINPFCFTIPR